MSEWEEWSCGKLKAPSLKWPSSSFIKMISSLILPHFFFQFQFFEMSSVSIRKILESLKVKRQCLNVARQREVPSRLYRGERMDKQWTWLDRKGNEKNMKNSFACKDVLFFSYSMPTIRQECSDCAGCRLLGIVCKKWRITRI